MPDNAPTQYRGVQLEFRKFNFGSGSEPTGWEHTVQATHAI